MTMLHHKCKIYFKITLWFSWILKTKYFYILFWNFNGLWYLVYHLSSFEKANVSRDFKTNFQIEKSSKNIHSLNLLSDIFKYSFQSMNQIIQKAKRWNFNACVPTPSKWILPSLSSAVFIQPIIHLNRWPNIHNTENT